MLERSHPLPLVRCLENPQQINRNVSASLNFDLTDGRRCAAVRAIRSRCSILTRASLRFDGIPSIASKGSERLDRTEMRSKSFGTYLPGACPSSGTFSIDNTGTDSYGVGRWDSSYFLDTSNLGFS